MNTAIFIVVILDWLIVYDGQIGVKKKKEDDCYLSNLYPCNKDSARMVFVDVATQPNKAAQNPSMLKLSSVIEETRIPPTMGTREAQIRQSKYFFQISHCNMTVQKPRKMFSIYSAMSHKKRERESDQNIIR